MIRELSSLVRTGPTPEELERAHAGLCEMGAGREASISRVLERAVNELLGLPAAPPDDQRIGTLASDMTDELRALESDLLYAVTMDLGPGHRAG